MTGSVKLIPLVLSCLIIPLFSSCALVTVPVKVVGKVATTTVGLAGKAAGAGIDAMKKDDEDKKQETPEGPDESHQE